jgi:hypothetical protein
MSESAAPVARPPPELAVVRQLELRAFPVSQAQPVSSQVAQARLREPPVVQPSQSSGLRAARLVAQPVRWKEQVLPVRRASSLAFLPQWELASREPAVREFPALRASFQRRQFPPALPAAIAARIPAPCCPAFDKASQRRNTPSPK